MIRYFALAFIFFQVATTAALATQVVLFAETEPSALLPLGPSAQVAGPEGDGAIALPPNADGYANRYPKVSTLYVEVPVTIAPSPRVAR